MIKTVTSLFSGSSGNCTYIHAGENKILIDAGGSAKAVCTALNDIGADISQISAIFITHEHCDHTHALSVLMKKHKIPVHMTRGSARALGLKDDSPICDCLVLHDREFKAVFPDGMSVEAFALPHDSAECVGYKIISGDDSVGIATDLGYVTQRAYDVLCGCKNVIIEANYDKEMVKNGKYSQSLKSRILSNGGHLSNDDCAEIVAALVRRGTRRFVLAHLSEENNTPEAALGTVVSGLGESSAEIRVAGRHSATVLFEAPEQI